MKKILLLILVALACAAEVIAGPHGCPGRCPGGFVGPGGIRPGCGPCHPGWGPGPGCHRDWWGRGGRNFWPGFVGGMIGGAIASRSYYGGYGYCPAPVVAAPTVVTTPVVTTPVVTAPVVYGGTTTYVTPTYPAPVVTTPVVTYPQATYQSVNTTVVVPPPREPLVGVNVLGLRVGVGY